MRVAVWRANKVTNEEAKADAIFLCVSFLIAVAVLFVFDIHWNFYPGGQLFPPEKYVFEDRDIYLWGGAIAAIVGFFLIKIFLIGLKSEERVWKTKPR